MYPEATPRWKHILLIAEWNYLLDSLDNVLYAVWCVVHVTQRQQSHTCVAGNLQYRPFLQHFDAIPNGVR